MGIRVLLVNESNQPVVELDATPFDIKPTVVVWQERTFLYQGRKNHREHFIETLSVNISDAIVVPKIEPAAPEERLGDEGKPATAA
jgi:hypothetical protein